MAEMSLESSYALPTIGSAQRTVFANQRTLEILEQRRTSGKARRRGWLMHRMLVLADVLALAATFAVVELAFGAGSGACGVSNGTGCPKLLTMAVSPYLNSPPSLPFKHDFPGVSRVGG